MALVLFMRLRSAKGGLAVGCTASFTVCQSHELTGDLKDRAPDADLDGRPLAARVVSR